MGIASPLLKCVLANGPELDSRFQHDVFASRHTFEDQARLTGHAVKIAHFFGARIIRVFSYWRTVRPDDCHDAIARALTELAAIGGERELDHRLRKRTRLQYRHCLGKRPGSSEMWRVRICKLSGTRPIAWWQVRILFQTGMRCYRRIELRMCTPRIATWWATRRFGDP